MSVALILILFTNCAQTSFEGEYSYDGRGPSAITILDNDTAELMFNGYAVVEYEKKGKHLEVLEKDIFRTFKDPITNVRFELTKDNDLRYILYAEGKVYDQTELKRIPGSDGKSGEVSFWELTIQGVLWGFLIFAITFGSV